MFEPCTAVWQPALKQVPWESSWVWSILPMKMDRAAAFGERHAVADPGVAGDGVVADADDEQHERDAERRGRAAERDQR